MASPSIQTRSHTHDSNTTSGHVGSCIESATNDQIPLAPSQDQKTSDSILTPDTVRSAIAPADHGKAAWLFLAGCFLTEGLIWVSISIRNRPLTLGPGSVVGYVEKKRNKTKRNPCNCVRLTREHSHRSSILLRCLPAIVHHPPAQHRRHRHHHHGLSSLPYLPLTLH